MLCTAKNILPVKAQPCQLERKDFVLAFALYLRFADTIWQREREPTIHMSHLPLCSSVQRKYDPRGPAVYPHIRQSFRHGGGLSRRLGLYETCWCCQWLLMLQAILELPSVAHRQVLSNVRGGHPATLPHGEGLVGHSETV